MITILRFMADWCGPCKAMQPAWDQLQEELKSDFIFNSVDIDTELQMRTDYSIRSIPTLVLVKDEKEIARKQGSASFSELKDWIRNEQGNL